MCVFGWLALVWTGVEERVGIGRAPPHRAAPATWVGRCTRHPRDSSHLTSQCTEAIPAAVTCCGSPPITKCSLSQEIINCPPTTKKKSDSQWVWTAGSKILKEQKKRSEFNFCVESSSSPWSLTDQSLTEAPLFFWWQEQKQNLKPALLCGQAHITLISKFHLMPARNVLFWPLCV